MNDGEHEDFKRDLEINLAKNTGRTDIEVTVGPRRSHDVKISEAPDGHPIVDFYSAMMWDLRRVVQAKNYAIDLIKNWGFVKAEAEAEKKSLKPTFEYIQGQFPQAELKYTTTERETHSVSVERREGRKPLVFFDLWFGMKPADINRLKEELIPEQLKRLEEEPRPSMAGTEYW